MWHQDIILCICHQAHMCTAVTSSIGRSPVCAGALGISPVGVLNCSVAIWVFGRPWSSHSTSPHWADLGYLPSREGSQMLCSCLSGQHHTPLGRSLGCLCAPVTSLVRESQRHSTASRASLPGYNIGRTLDFAPVAHTYRMKLLSFCPI